jgi:hypothetical protein
MGPLSGALVNFRDKTQDPQQAIAALQAWRAALHSVSLTFETIESSGAKTVVEWDWSEDGSIRENTYYDFGPQRPGNRSAWLFTRGKFYLLRYPEGQSDYWRPESVAISARNSGAWESVVTPLYGLWRNSFCRWISDEIGTMTEWLPPAGEHLVGVVMSKLRVELDPRQGYLPVETASNPGNVFHNIVEDFEVVAPGILFPKRGIFVTTTRQPLHGATRHETRWEMTSIRINDSRTAGNFKPPRPHRSIGRRQAVLVAALAAALAIAGLWWLMQTLFR